MESSGYAVNEIIACFYRMWMMKKYLKPEVVRVEVCTVNMLAASAVNEASESANKSAASDIGRERVEWGNLWNK